MLNTLIISLTILGSGIVALELGVSVAMLEVIGGMFARNIFGITGDAPWLQFLSHLGLAAVIFYAGFETNIKVLKKYFKRSMVISIASFLAPFFAITTLTYYLFISDLRVASIVGIAFSTTSLALTYPILSQKGLMKEKSGQVLFVSAMLVDVLSMAALAVVSAEPFTTDALLIVGAFAISVVSLPYLAKYFLKRYKRKDKEDLIDFEVRFVLLVLIGIAFIAENIPNVHTSIIAFIFGIILSEMFPDDRAAEKKIKGFIFGFLAPFFFFSAGLNADLEILKKPVAWIALIALIFAAYSSKYLATKWAVGLYYPRISNFAGDLFNIPLTFGIVAVTIGLEGGFLPETLYAVAMVALVAITIISNTRIPANGKKN